MNKRYTPELMSKMSVSSELRVKVENLVLDLIQKAQEYFKNQQGYQKINLVPDIVFDLTSRSTGTCLVLHNKWTIRLNPILFNNNQDYFFSTTIPHEVAHGIVRLMYGYNFDGIKPHGHHWKYVMSNIFGITPKRGHQLDVSEILGLRKRRRIVRHVYKCNSCGKTYMLTSTRHNRMCKIGGWYICRLCRGKLSYENSITL